MPERILRVIREADGARSVMAEVALNTAEVVFVEGEDSHEEELQESGSPIFTDVLVMDEALIPPAPMSEPEPAAAAEAPEESAPKPAPKRAASRKSASKKSASRKSSARKA
jgi:hypothetical protein